MKKLGLMILTGLTCSVLSSNAFAGEKGPKDQMPPRPPKEVMEKMAAACVGKNENDVCSFKGREDRDVPGKCALSPRGDGKLGCKPDHRPGPPRE